MRKLASVVDTLLHARAVSEMIGGLSLCLLGLSVVLLFHSGLMDESQCRRVPTRERDRKWPIENFY